VTSPLSLEHCSALLARGPSRFASPAVLSPPPSWIGSAIATDEQVISARAPLPSMSAIHSLGHHFPVLPQGVPVMDGFGG
jgi:hypothetical protein